MLGRGGHQTITVTEKINPATNEVLERTFQPPHEHPGEPGQLSAAEHAQAILDAIDGIAGAAPVEDAPDVIDVVEAVPALPSPNGDGQGGTFT